MKQQEEEWRQKQDQIQNLLVEAEEHQNKVREFFRGDYGEYLIDQKLLQQVEKTLLLFGYQAVDESRLEYLTRNEGKDLLAYIKGLSDGLPSIEIIRNNETMWSAYKKLAKDERIQFEHNVFPEVLPLWFASLKFKLEETEHRAQKKQRSKEKKESKVERDSKSLSNKTDVQQMGFDF
ncbi:hypothetical protein [Paenibacillus terrae]|uniref:Uncharacterized protein n=1 Tax=Paenibacillus terrae TaxID=159743 RepID=A0A0D7WX95_9BACL|nr:hypothetical protein [Paenibacillus terrae]KJD42357.1 hypothetical protein QD47_28685 [Paenibacillus terrae]